MRPSLVALLLACAGVHSAQSATPGAPGQAFPAYASAAALKTACDRGLARAKVLLARMEQRAPDKGWIRAYDAYSAAIEDLSSPVSFVSAVHPDKAIRSASEACELRWNDFFSTQGQNARLFKAVQRVKPGDETDRQLRQRLLDGFEDSGVGLAPAERAQAKQLTDRIAELGQVFDRHIRDANVRLPFALAELVGVPEGLLGSAKRDEQGRLLLGLDAPTYFPLMQTATVPATRERMWRAKMNEGGQANLDLLAEITRLRKQYASLFGMDSWDAFVLRRRMAKTPQRALAFLDEVHSAVQQRERDELRVLRQAKAEGLKQPLEATHLERWDRDFYAERERQARFKVDQEAFREYFPPQASLQFALRVIERLMGVRYQRIEGAKAWHPEVQTYSVSDASSGRALATLWVDLYPREGKYNHAAVWGLRSSSIAQKRPSQAALVVNFDRKGLTLDELETLLHELGHSVHNNLSATRWALQAGTSVLHDFVEAPSQMLEDWVYDKKVLQLFAEVCPDCKPVPDALLAQAVAARDYGKGMQFARQHLYASYDLALYGPEVQDPMALWSKMEGATPLGTVAGTMFPAGFSHIAGGYSAGYYGYLWSLVVAMDLRTAFAADKLDAQVGRRYRDDVLAQGSQRPPGQLVHDFLGRDFNAKAFFEDLKR